MNISDAALSDVKPDTAIGTIVITMELQTGKMAIQGNVLPDVDLTLRMLIEAAHSILRNDLEAKPVTH